MTDRELLRTGSGQRGGRVGPEDVAEYMQPIKRGNSACGRSSGFHGNSRAGSQQAYVSSFGFHGDSGMGDEDHVYHSLDSISAKHNTKLVVRPAFTKDGLELFFESRRKWPPKGFTVKVEVNKEKDEAVVTFECESDLKQVLEKQSKDRLIWEGTTMDIRLYQAADAASPPPPPADASSKTEDWEDCSGGNEMYVYHIKRDTIQVTGFKKETSEDCLSNYFENNLRSAGGEVRKTSIDRDEGRAIIVFKDQNVVPRVLDRQHTVEGQRLTVEPLIPNPKALLLTGLCTDKISEENLCNFLEAKLHQPNIQVTYNVDRTRAIARCPENIDFDAIERACKQKVLDCSLSVSKVSVSSCIVITHLPEHVSHDEILHYFENNLRSHGGEIQKVDPHFDDGYAVVTFKDAKVVDNVCAKTDHTLSGIILKVAPFYPCLGITPDCQPEQVNIPEPCLLSKYDQDIIKLLECKTKWKQRFVSRLSADHHAAVCWSDPRRLECTLTKEMPNFRSCVKKWTSKVTDFVYQFVTGFTVKEIEYPSDMQTEVDTEMHSLKVDHPEDILIITKRDTHTLVLVCPVELAQSMTAKLNNAVDKVVKEVKANREIGKKEANVKPWKARYLEKVNFRQALINMHGKLEVQINASVGKVELKGPMQEVTDGLSQMYEQLENLKSHHPYVKEGKVRLLENPVTRDQINKQLVDEGFLDVWEVEGGKLILYGESDTDFDKMEDIVCKPLETLTFKKDKPLKAILSSDKWTAKQSELQNKFEGFIDINTEDDSVEIFVTADKKQEVSDFFQSFMKKNTVFKEQISFDGNICRFFKEVLEDSLMRRLTDLKKNGTTVNMKDNGTITIEGTADNVKEAKKILNEIKGTIVQSTEQIQSNGICHLFKRPVGAGYIKQVEEETKCIISCKDTNLGDSLVLKQQTGQRMIKKQTPCAEAKVQGTKLKVVAGDITEFDVDVIVSPANKDLKLFGGIAGIVLKKGGQEIADECKQRIKKKGALSPGQVFMGSAGKLSFKKIIHAMGPVWKDGQEGEDQDLQTCLEKCLKKCDKEKLHRLALPALSTGMYGYPVDKACCTIIQSVCGYLKNHKTSLKEIIVCDVKVLTVDAFVKALQAECSDVNVLESLGVDSKPRPNWIVDSDAAGAAGASRGAAGRGADEAAANKRDSKPRICVGPITVEIVKGELIKEKTDVIVNSTSTDLRLDIGQSSKALLHAAGNSIQQECKDNHPRGIHHGSVAMSTGGNLGCKKVFHIALRKFDDDEDFQSLQHSVTACLKEADQHGFSTISFPTLGTGGQHYPKAQVAKKMIQTISNFTKKNRGTGITDVRIVVFYKDTETFKAFKDAEKDWSSSDDSSDQRSDRGHMSPRQSEIRHSVAKKGKGFAVFQIGGLRVSASHGDIVDQDTDAIVASCNKEMDLKKGKVTSAILKKGGEKEILQECKKHKEEMSKHGIAVTDACRLKTKHVIYVDTKYKTWQWKPVVVSCLQKAEEYQIESLSLPLFGTNTGSKADDITKIMYDALLEFLKNPPKHLQKVKIVIYRKQEEDMLPMVIRTLESAVEGGKGPVKQRQSSASSSSNASDGTLDSNMDILKLKVLATDKNQVKEAVERLKTIVKKTWQTKPYQDESVPRLTPKEVAQLKQLAEKNHVIMELDKVNSEVRLTGQTKDIFNVSDQLQKYFLHHIKTQHRKDQAAQLSNLVGWSYLKDGKSYPFPAQDNLKIEEAYKKKEKQVQVFDRSGEKYIVDLTNMQEYNAKDSKKKFDLIRRDKMEEKRQNLPPKWASMNQNENLKMVTVQSASPEYKKVESDFAKSLGRTPTIVKIDRIQNKTLWTQYEAKKQQVEATNPKRKNERILWHGTAVNAVDSINNHGFNRSYCGKNAVAYGEGVYFAVSAAYSDQAKYSQPDGSGHKRIYKTRVLTGEYTNGHSGMRVLPTRENSMSHVLYDSATNNVNNPSMFVIFHDTQAYPEYIITYQ